MARDKIATSEPPEERILSLEEFYFKQICRIRIGPPPDNCRFSQLVATNDKYGLVAAGHAKGVRVISIATILENDMHVTDKVNTIIDNVDYIGDVVLTSEPVHIGFSADGLIMSVACHSLQNPVDSSNPVPTVYFYDVRAFCRKKTPEPFITTHLGAGQDVAITDFRWNPEESDVFAASLSNGSLFVAKCTFPGHIDLKELAPQSVGSSAQPHGDDITCICWSPKGKQLVAGRADGLLVQLSKTLEVKARVPAPPGISKGAALSVLWQSTYVFFVSYGELNETAGDVQPTMVGVYLAKDGQVTAYHNYGDLCFGSSDTDQQCGYYMVQIPKWDIILALSATSISSCVLGKVSAEQPWPWQPWTLDDSGQIAMPLQQSDDNDSFPRGLALTLTAQNEVPGQGPGLSYPASPVVFVLSTEGLLMPYHVINSLPASSSITKPPEQLSSAGIEFVNSPPTTGTADRATVAASAYPGISLLQSASGGVLSNKPARLPDFFGSSSGQGMGSMPHNSAYPSLGESTAAVPVSTLKPQLIPPVVSQSQQVPPAYNEAPSGMLTFSKTPMGVPALNKPPAESGLTQHVQLEQKTSSTASMPAPTSSLPARSIELEPKSVTTDSLYSRAIQEEVTNFAKEVAALRMSCQRNQNVSDIVGSKEEFIALSKQLGELTEDGRNIMATVQSCATDVHELKLKVLETFTLLEQCRSLQRCYNHPEYQDLLKSRPLDHLLKSKSQEVERLYRSVQQSLDDLSQRIDDDWANVVQQQQLQRLTPGRSGRSPGRVGASPARARLHPSGSGLRALDCNDKIYSATKTTELILHSQELLADELTKRLKALHLGTPCSGSGATFVHSRHEHGDLSTEVCAGGNVSKASFAAGGGEPEAPSGSRPRRLTPAANALLCRYLGSRKATDSVAAKPASLSLSKVIAAEKLKQQLTLLQHTSGSLPTRETTVRDSGRVMADRQQSELTCSITREPATTSDGILTSRATRQAAAPVGIALGQPEASSKSSAGSSLLEAAQDLPLQQRQAAVTAGSPFVTSAPRHGMASTTVPPAASKTSLSAFASMAQPAAAQPPARSSNADRLGAAAAESVRPMPSPAVPLPRTSAGVSLAAGGIATSSATFKPMATPTGQLLFGPAGSGNPPSAFSIFGGVGISSSGAGRASEKPAPGTTTETSRSALPTATTEGALPMLASIAQKVDTAGRQPPPQANRLGAAAGSAPSLFGTLGIVADAGAKLLVGSSGAASLSKSMVSTAGSGMSWPSISPAIAQNRTAAVDASQPLTSSAVAPTLPGSSVPSGMGKSVFGSSSFAASSFGQAAEHTTGFGGFAQGVSGLKPGSSLGFGGMPSAAATFGLPASMVALPPKATSRVLQKGTLTGLEGAAAPAVSTTAASAGGAPILTSLLLPAASKTSQEGAQEQLQSGSGGFAFNPAVPPPQARAAPLSATAFTSGTTDGFPPAAIAASPTPTPTAEPAPAPTAELAPGSLVTASSAATSTAATTVDTAAATSAALLHPLSPHTAVPAVPTSCSTSAGSSALLATAAAGSGNVLPAAPSVTPAMSSPSMSSWTGGATTSSVFGSASVPGNSSSSGASFFGKPPAPNIPAVVTSSAGTAGKDSTAASSVSGDTEMSTEHDDGSAAGGNVMGFGVGASSNILGLGGKADPEKAKLNPFGMVPAATSAGASEAAKLFGSPLRPAVFGAAPVFGSQPAMAAGSVAAVFGSSPVIAPASHGGPTQSPFSSAGSAAPSVFGGSSGFGAATTHTPFGAPPSFGSPSVFGAGASAFGGGSGGASAFGGAPVFGALASSRTFGGGSSSPAASVFGGQAQFGSAGSAPCATFGSFEAVNVASQPTFGMLAQQQTSGPQPTFGMLAQQQTPAIQPGSVFGSTAAFGSSSPVAAPKIQSPSFTSYRK